MGLAGTVMRFVPPVAALADGEVFFDGDPHARKRPMGAILRALRALGAEVSGDALPFTVRGPLTGGEVRLDASGSSQFLSGLLLAAARFEKGVTVRHDGPPIPSQPHIQMTVQMLREFGVGSTTPSLTSGGSSRARSGPGTSPWSPTCPTRRRSSAPPWSPAARSPSPAGPQETTQPGDQLRTLLADMGASVETHARRAGGHRHRARSPASTRTCATWPS